MSKHQILDAFKRNDLTPVFSLYSEDFRVQQTEASCLMAPDYTRTDSGVRILISKQKLEQHNLQLWHTYDSTCEEINDKYFLWKVNIQNNICRTNLILLTPWGTLKFTTHWILLHGFPSSSGVYCMLRFWGTLLATNDWIHLILHFELIRTLTHVKILC